MDRGGRRRSKPGGEGIVACRSPTTFDTKLAGHNGQATENSAIIVGDEPIDVEAPAPPVPLEGAGVWASSKRRGNSPSVKKGQKRGSSTADNVELAPQLSVASMMPARASAAATHSSMQPQITPGRRSRLASAKCARSGSWKVGIRGRHFWERWAQSKEGVTASQAVL